MNTPAGISLSRVFTAALSLVTAPIIAHAIGPEGRGLTAGSLAAIQIIGIAAGMGVPLAVRRRSVQESDRADLIRTARLFGWFTAVPAAAVGVACLLLFLGGLGPVDSVIFLIAMASGALTVLWTIDANVFVAEKMYFRIVSLSSIQTVVYFAVIVCLWAFGALTVGGVLLAFVAGTVAAFALGRFWVRAGAGKVRGLGSLCREGATMWGSQAAEIASYRLDQLLVLPVIGASATGIYSIAVTIGTLPFSLAVGLGAAVFQGFARSDSKDLVVTALRHIFVVTSAVSIVLGVAAVWVVPLLFGERFSESVPVAWITLIGCQFIVGNYIAVTALVSRKQGMSMTAMQVIGLAVGIAALYPLGAVWGPMGAATASSLGYAVTLAFALFALRISPLAVVPRPRDVRPAFKTFLERG
ncbi:Membrane protein involved in the export of O-antigen and teichoic acid [Rathayibacter oskolensis]|uniref:Membrane protein involved in the export of O-antigen and teichoic acid n=1 Tax=Rathayibacter oskolensis TaxID=1891671 RepID=A0A1X7NAS5_9MICO|nr:oligosaccharide flippase family protein [Rathayibacter oskolensis]SMH34698.1 Membrane protein involved in the export of O-antigen and teichoic acid [Rathayibacter oskolensis]